MGTIAMALHTDTIDTLDTLETLAAVEAELNYLAPTKSRPRTYAYAPPNNEPQTTQVNEPHRVSLRNARPFAGSLSLDHEGLYLIEHRSATRDFYDDDQIMQIYYPEAERALKNATGADRIFIFDHTVRRRVRGAEDRRGGP